MSKINFLKDQIIESRSFVNRLISELPEELWYALPDNTDSNFAWQIGHLIVSQNFHGIACVTGRNERVSEIIPVLDYVKLFNGMGSTHRSIEKNIIPIARLKQQLAAIHDICLNSLDTINDNMLNDDLEPIPFKHPMANTKYDALSWCFKHEMWHAAEMEAIKLALQHPIVWIKA